jgi:ABC-type enterochelin transport system substrate-binding protein
MRIRITIAAITAALAITLVGCSSDDSPDSETKPTKTGTPEASSTVDQDDAEKAAGIPADPQGAKRTALIAALKAIDPALVTDEDKAVDNARNQCSTISGGGNAELTAKGRFSTSDHEVTDAEAKAINAALKATLCP